MKQIRHTPPPPPAPPLRCTGCGACVNICPSGALRMEPDPDGFPVPRSAADTCTDCGLCRAACPVPAADGTASEPGPGSQARAWYGWHRDDRVRQSSSSGGIFSALAETVLAAGGTVFGAVYNAETRRVVHAACPPAAPEALRKSKYAQSETGDTFRAAARVLATGKPVLFCGAPCQIAGLEAFFRGRRPAGLVTADFICHGSSSAQLLGDHIGGLEKRFGVPHTDCDFRPKEKGWNDFRLFVRFRNGRIYKEEWRYDPYYRGFMENTTLRGSCYDCPYATGAHKADITLADFWGYAEHYPELNADNRGLSLVLLNRPAAEAAELLTGNPRLELHEIPAEHARYAFRKRTPERYNRERRERFFELYRQYGFQRAARESGLVTGFWKRWESETLERLREWKKKIGVSRLLRKIMGKNLKNS